jgi:hypothetical protein
MSFSVRTATIRIFQNYVNVFSLHSTCRKASVIASPFLCCISLASLLLTPIFLPALALTNHNFVKRRLIKALDPMYFITD